MSTTTLLSTFYDIDYLCKQTEKALNLNLTSILDKKAVGSPVTTSSSSFTPAFLRRHSTSNLQVLANSNSSTKFSSSNSFCNNLKEMAAVAASTALLNKENKFRERSFSENGAEHRISQQLLQPQPKTGAQINSARYKTELCRPFEENGTCKYGDKCQFAHGFHELRSLTRHPKYKTELCRTFHTIGFCPYGPRCHFIHNADERRPAPPNANGGQQQSNGTELRAFQQQQRDGMPNFNQRPKLHHSLSFSEFSSSHGLDSPPVLESPTSRTPPPATTTSSAAAAAAAVALYCEELLSPSFSCANNAFSFSGQDLGSLFTPLAIQTQNFANQTQTFINQNRGYYLQNQNRCGGQSSYTESPSLTQRRFSESPVFGTSPNSPESLSDQESYPSGSSHSSSGSLSDSESPNLDSNRRQPQSPNLDSNRRQPESPNPDSNRRLPIFKSWRSVSD